MLVHSLISRSFSDLSLFYEPTFRHTVAIHWKGLETRLVPYLVNNNNKIIIIEGMIMGMKLPMKCIALVLTISLKTKEGWEQNLREDDCSPPMTTTSDRQVK